MVKWWHYLALVCGLGALGGLWWVFWQISLLKHALITGPNWWEDYGEPIIVLILWTFVWTVVWETVKALKEHHGND